MDPNALPSVIVTDRELALTNAITNVFPHATNLLCRWHIGNNMLAKGRKMFDDKMWEEFICSWGLVFLSSSVAQYKERLCVLKCNFEMVPAALELMLLQVTEFKASFEKSLNSVQHDFRTTLFDRLRGVVSSNAMTLVLAVSHQVEWFVESKRQCECSLRHTHGLPCAHEIAPYKMANIPLPIELIHDHWKRLSLLATQNEGSMEETLLAYFDCFYNKFLNEDQYDVKLNYVKKMQELAHPKISILVEPKFSEPIRPYIESVKDVEDDGNCGFWAVSGFMKGDVHEWLMVISDLLKELETHLHLYEQVEHWMTMPDMGHIIASAYNCVLVYLSNVQCLTFLPLQSKPLPSMKRKVIAIGFVDGGNFVQDAAHVAAIQKFNEIIGVDVATKEWIIWSTKWVFGAKFFLVKHADKSIQ
ncbi:uncharacterized protein LOC131309542 [Rhododendron vialii]|uniref:uncharacterized protein LOC131309542 n=1 Tax=Rhododendron vialii TaxID=182163 RepID=UPI00265F1FC6|nr:uncharacterized protein LOC131309542 [Rhododendron vialii]